ncbi:MAG TPA: hypothetical protein VK470_14265, partial [Bacteroidota bacterium]|nr:hypothetical protein [Bacteroidota bacterium]
MKRIVTLMLCLLAGSAAFAQDLNITGAGARAEGFGGAFIGVADDATAIVWNPAGLTQLERAEASVVTRIISEKAEYTSTFYSSSDFSVSQTHASFNFGSVALPFKLGSTTVVIAAAYQRQIDLYSNLKTDNSSQEGKGGVDTFTPGLSLKLSPVFSVGAAANIWTGKHELTMDRINSRMPSLTQNLTYKGFNMVIGGLVDLEALPKPVPIKLGVTVRTPFELKGDGENTVYQTLKANRTVEMPLMLGFGASFRLSENFTVAADYEIRSYGEKNMIDELGGSALQPVALSASGKDLTQVRVGAEYLFVSKNYVIPLRAGYRTVPTLLANTNALGVTSDQVTGKAISIGSGYISNAFAIDVAYTLTDYTQTFGTTDEIKYTTGTISAS